VLKVERSRNRRLVTVDGDEQVTEIVKYCPVDGMRFGAESLRRLTPVRSPYSFDLLVRIGRLRYCKHLQIGEIQAEIGRVGLFIPRSTLQRLCIRFLRYYIAVHLESMSLLAEQVRMNGGYVLQVDGSQNHGRGTLLLVKDMISGFRLFASRFPSENKDDLVVLFRYLENVFGVPLVAIRDGGKGIVQALERVFPEVYQVYCHFHFLRALGSALFDRFHVRFKKMLNGLGVKGKLRVLYIKVCKQRERDRSVFVSAVLDELIVLLEYVLKYKGEGLGYPFELQDLCFYEKCLLIEKPIQMLVTKCAKQYVYVKNLCMVKEALCLLHPSSKQGRQLQRDVARLQERKKWFDDARSALRWRNGPVPLSTQIKWNEKDLQNARRGINDFLSLLQVEKENKGISSSLKRGLVIIEDRFRTYKDNLLAPNIQIDTDHGKKIVVLERTNNSVEMDFRRCRRHVRRLQGNSDVEEVIQREGVGLSLLLNMNVSKYVKIVYGSWDCMGKRFSKVDEKALEQADLLLQGYNPWWAQ
jgi:hypothetical protein